MTRYIKNISEIEHKFVVSDAWDIVEFDLTLNEIKIAEYLQTIITDFNKYRFDFNSKDYLNDDTYKRYLEENKVTNYVGNITGWTLSWPIERDIPIPSQVHANLEIYPELKTSNLYYDSKLMNKYNFGYMATLHDALSVKFLRQMIITKHRPGVKTVTHVDGERKKIHIPLQSDKDAIFHFGPNGEREYTMDVGKIYMINPSVPHGTINKGSLDRYHLISRVDFDFISQVLAMKGKLE
jgi:uncharacterized RmlC-like cupin family protein